MAKVRLRWSTKGKGTVKTTGFTIYQSEHWMFGWEKIGSTSGKEYEIDNLGTGKKIYFAIGVTGGQGQETLPSDRKVVSITPKEKVSVPATPTNFVARQSDDRVIFTWDDALIADLDYYELRRGLAWAGGKFIGKFTREYAQPLWDDTGEQKFWLKTADKQGNLSVTPASVTITIQELENAVVKNTWIETDSLGSGTITDGVVISGTTVYTEDKLIWTQRLVEINDFDEEPIWGQYRSTGTSYTSDHHDLGYLGWHYIYSTVETDINDFDFEIYDLKNTFIGGGLFTSGDEYIPQPQLDAHAPREPINGWDAADEITQEIAASVTDEATEVSVVWGDDNLFQPGAYYCRWIRITINLNSFLAMTTIVIQNYKIIHKLINKKDEGKITLVSDPGPTVITFTTVFSEAPSLICQPVDDTGDFVKIESISATQATVRVYNQALYVEASVTNVRAYDDEQSEVFTGTLHWIAAGI